MQKIILEVKDLKQYFEIPMPKEKQKGLKAKMFGAKQTLKAVNGVSFEIYEGETFGLVGESGSGKSTVGRTLIRLYEPTAGKINFNGRDIAKSLTKNDKLKLASEMQMIFQDPFASVNPRLTVEEIIGEGLRIHKPELDKVKRRETIIELLEKVGLSKDHLSRYPHEFSGGQLQRIGIARAIAVNPKFIIADESISALDVSIQAQVVNLLKEMQADLKLTYLFIAHDLSMVKYISDRIAVMYRGKILELGSAKEIYNNPIHPYTKSLLSAIPHPDPIFERSNTRIKYDETIHDYEKENPKIQEITKSHFVYLSDEELVKYR